MIAAFFLSLLGTACAVLALMPLAVRLGLMDRPGGHKAHRVETPLAGGIGMFIGSAAAATALGLEGLTPYGGALLLGGGLLVAAGAVDDRRGLGVSLRFLVQIAAALVAALWGGVAILDLGDLLGSGVIHLGWGVLPLTAFAMVGAMNAMNMMDGADGLGGGMALVTLALLSLLAWQGGMEGDLLWLLALCGAVSGFLAFNARVGRMHARVFMGDAGSLFLGFAIALFLIHLSQGEGRAMTPVTALWVFALPLMDTVAIMLRRILRGQSPFSADRDHLHHVLMRGGFSVNQAVLLMMVAGLLLGFLGLAGLHLGIPEAAMFYGFLGLFGLYFWGMRHAWKVAKALRHWRGEVLEEAAD